MQEIFGKDFGRMVIPAARDVEVELYLLQNLKDVRTWGYHASIEGRWDSYELQEGDAPEPYGVAVGKDGYVYISDDANCRVQKFDDEGNLILQWGRRGNREWGREDEAGVDRAEGKFNLPRDLAVDSEGYVYVADTGNFRIQKFDGEGRFISQWGGPGSREGQFREPVGVAVDDFGHVYVADSDNHRVQKFDRDGVFVTQWGGFGSEIGQFRNPRAVATDIYSNVYVADLGNNRVQIFENDGNFIASFDSDELGKEMVAPAVLAVDLNGNIYMADSRNNRVKKFDMEGNYVKKWGSYGREDIPFDNLSALAVDGGGHVYVADSAGNRIQMFDGDGAIMIRQPIRFSLPTVNLGDYETIVIKAEIPAQENEGERSIARLEVSYTDMDGTRVRMDPIEMRVSFVDMEHPVSGPSDATVLRVSAMLHYAQMLREIGVDYHYGNNARLALEKTSYTKNELHNVQDRLGESVFEDEIALLEKYIGIIGADAGFNEMETERMMADTGLTAAVGDRSLSDHLDNLFEEVLLDLRAREASNIALLGFGFPDDREADLLVVLNESAELHLTGLEEYKLIDRDVVEHILDEEGYAPSDLMDTDSALAAGSAISAHYILTGTVIEMNESVAIFCRVINVETALIESVGQVVIPRTAEVDALL
jgi:DNA-binding beta-propeller fold protein YncE